MAQRVAEHVVRRRLFGPRELLRVDLHGVSRFGAGDDKALIRWEWVEGIDVDGDSVVIRSATETITLPPGCFGLAGEALADELARARSIQDRSDVIRRLSGGTPDGHPPVKRLRSPRKRLRLPRPSRRRFGAFLALVGVVAGAAFLVVPVSAAFADDPLLRYGRFGGSDPGTTDVECGAPVSNLLRRSDGPSFYSLAREDACHRAASERVATAVAAGALLGVLGLTVVTSAAREARA